MSTGYDNVTVHDSNNYWGGAMIFQYNPEDGSVVGWWFRRVDGDGLQAAENREATLEREQGGTVYTLPMSVLFHSENFMIHRWACQYVTVKDMLVHISLEPRDRRMFKGANLRSMRVLGVYRYVEGNIEYHSDRQARDLALLALQRQDALPNALANVLAYGNHDYFLRDGESPAVWKNNAKQDAILSMRRPKTGAKFIVPDPDTALIRHPTKQAMHVLHRGVFVGTLTPNGTEDVKFTSTWPSEQGTPEESALVESGLRTLIARLFNCEVDIK